VDSRRPFYDFMAEEAYHPDLAYEPAPEVSKDFTTRFNAIVPISPNGRDRMLRYIWGMDRTEFVAGYDVRRYSDVDHEPAKYVGRARWVLEGWQSPDVYDRKEWEAVEHLLGPFPARGVWDFIEYHVGPNEEYLPLNGSALRRAESWAHWRSKGAKRSIEFLMYQKMRKWALQEKIRQERADAVAAEFGEQYVKLIENETNPVSTSGNGGFKKTAGGILVPI